MNVFILAAGLGTRFKPLTLKMPKPTIPFLNVPMGYYNFRFLKSIESQIDTLVANTHHLPDQVEKLYANQNFIRIKAQFSNESPIILGTAGGIKKASGLFKKGEPILVMNADEIILTQNDGFLKDALAQHQKNDALATLVVMKHEEVGKKFGAIVAKDRSVKNIVVPKDFAKATEDASLKAWHYPGIIILSWEVINLINSQQEQNIFYDILINHLDRVQIFPIEADWFETGNQADFLKATEFVLNKLQQHPLDEKYKYVLNFVNQVDPSRLIHNEKTLSLVSLASKVNEKYLAGFNTIAATAKIENATGLKNCVAFNDEKLT